MSLYNDYGIIFKIRNFSEADKIISILTKNSGRVEAIGKGARRPTSRKTSSIDLFNEGKFSFAKGKNLDILIEVELKDDHEKIKRNLSLSKHLFYFSELIDKFFPETGQGEEIFDDSLELLSNLSSENEGILQISFELRILNVGGFGPNLETCDLCGDPIKEGIERVPHAGSGIGFICAKHLKGENYTIIEDRVIKILRFIHSNKFVKTITLKVSPEDLSKIKKLNKLWIQSIIGKELKSYKFLQQ